MKTSHVDPKVLFINNVDRYKGDVLSDSKSDFINDKNWMSKYM